MSHALAELRAAGAPILDLTRLSPTECGFSYAEQRIHEAFRTTELLRYRPEPQGLLSAREAVGRYYRGQRAAVAVEDLVLTSGTSEGYSFIFRLLCNSGDEVLIPAPGYPLFDFLADLCDVKLIRYPLVYDHGWQIDFPALAAAITKRTRAIIVVHPNNPTGNYASAAEQNQLLEFCGQRGLALIADEVFLDFSVSRSRGESFASSNQTLAFTLSGISKICGLPQMKLAWIAVGGPEKEKGEALARLEIIADAYLSVGTPVQLAAAALLEMGADFRRQAMARIRANLGELDAQLSRQSACMRLECQGGWSAVLRVPALQQDEDLVIALLRERGLHVHPGHFYDFAQSGHVVVSLIVPEADFAEGIRRLLAHFT